MIRKNYQLENLLYGERHKILLYKLVLLENFQYQNMDNLKVLFLLQLSNYDHYIALCSSLTIVQLFHHNFLIKNTLQRYQFHLSLCTFAN